MFKVASSASVSGSSVASISREETSLASGGKQIKNMPTEAQLAEEYSRAVAACVEHRSLVAIIGRLPRIVANAVEP